MKNGIDKFLIPVVGALILILGTSFKGGEKTDKVGESTVKWMSFEEAVEANKTNPKKIFIDVYTDWCGWCKKMDAGTFNHPDIAKYLNENYHAVKLNAEQKENIEFNDHIFKFIASGKRGIHELAYSLLDGKLSYPTVVFMDEEFRIISPVPGYLKPGIFDKIIKYYGGDNHKSIPWDKFQENYVSTIE